MTDKQIKDEIKQVVTNLGNIKFTVEDELEFCKQVLKRKEQECERLSSLIRETETYSDVCCECRDEILTYPTIAGRTDYTQIEVEELSLKKIIQQLDQLKAELNSAKELREYTYDCCKRAGEELAKNSFDWDGKEKNLVVQAMELNERYDQLKAELEAYKMEAEEGKEINAELKAENDELRKCYKNNSALLDFEETNTTKVVNKVMKLEKTLTEIKEIIHFNKTNRLSGGACISIEQILQKISECEVGNG